MILWVKQLLCKHNVKIVIDIVHISNKAIDNYYKPIRKVICNKCGKEYKLGNNNEN